MGCRVDCMAKSTTVVVPPKAAARVPVSISSALSGAAEGHVEVGVHVDAAGQDEHAGGVDDRVAESAGMSARLP